MTLNDCVTRDVSFERPRLDVDLRPALALVPDQARFVVRTRDQRVIVAVPRRTLASLIGPGRGPLWRDFDDHWDGIAAAALCVLESGRYDRQADERTGLRRIVLEPEDLAPRSL